MNRSNIPLAILLSLGMTPAIAQVRVQIDIGLPEIPRLVVIQPGVQVVEGFQEEVFFHQGWYWCRRHDGWYRARTPRAHFEWVEVRRVPRVLVKAPEGHYRNWHHEARPEHRRHEIRREERRDEGRRDRREEHGKRDHRKDPWRDRADHPDHER